MTRSQVKTCLCLLIISNAFYAYSASSTKLKYAAQYGAEGKVTLHVVDDQGVPVSDAEADVALFEKSSYANIKKLEGVTDTNGFFIVEGKTIGEMRYSIKNDEFYITRGEYWFYSSERESVKDGRWLPWNPAVPVILKPKKNPIPMYVKRVDIEIPEQNKSLGFDFEKGDWVAPYGMGVIADLHFFYSLETQDLWTGVEQFEIANTNLMCGVQETEGDTYSTFISKYEAPAEGFNYRWNDILNRTKTKIIERKKLAEENYLIFRSRAIVDSQGKLVRANYGKIYPPIKHGVDGGKAELSFTYYFNPIPNDRNLEFDPDKNLFGGRENFAP